MKEWKNVFKEYDQEAYEKAYAEAYAKIPIKNRKQLEKLLDEFYNLVKNNKHFIAQGLNGFYGIGELKTPRKHVKTENTINMTIVGMNDAGTKIKKQASIDMTHNELKLLKLVIEKIFTIIEGGKQ